QVLHQDPFTYRAFSKPRGYAGDAVMMDYIYGLGDARQADEDATPIGRAVFAHMATRPSARGALPAPPARIPDRRDGISRRPHSLRARGRPPPRGGAVSRSPGPPDRPLRRDGSGPGEPGGRLA